MAALPPVDAVDAVDPVAAPAADGPGSTTGPAPTRPTLLRTAGLVALEGIAGVLVAFGFTAVSAAIRVNPMTRVGQVSGLAALQLRFIFAAIAIALVWLAASRWLSRGVGLRLACGSLAGLATGLYAGGIAVALRGTSWPLNGKGGDSGQLQNWAVLIHHGRPISGVYPPLFPYLLSYWTDLFNPGRPGAALKILTLVLTALAGPAVYLAWRLLLPPLWALAIGVVSVFPIFTAAKPYVDIVLLLLVPVFAKFLGSLSRSTGMSVRTALLVGAGYGAVFAVFFLWYSGWFVWSAPGALACLVLALVKAARWGRAAAARALLLLGGTGVVFLLLAGRYLMRLLAGSGTPDAYMYFDTETDPAYFTTWLGSLPGGFTHAIWPMPGELGGVGVFTLILLLGIGVALWLGADLPVVQVAGFFMLGSFMLRYWFASHMERDHLVQLYPRTSSELLYCCLVLVGVAAHLVVRRIGALRRSDGSAFRLFAAPAMRTTGAVLCSLTLFFALAGSATVDRFMPANQNSLGWLAWVAHTQQLPDGTCPGFAPGGTCEPWPKGP
jgi:galactan 5-O-arabinofuranosyltransferase